MHYLILLSLLCLCLFSASCSLLVKDEAEIEKIADDVVEEIIEDSAKL